MPATLAGVWIVLTVLLVLFLTAAGTVLGTRQALRRRNRVVAGVNSPVPLTWMHSGRREARTHRRLQMSGRRLELVPPSDDVAGIVARLRVELVELDAYLVTVARRPREARRADRPEIHERAAQIEELVRRVEERVRTELVSLDELSERLDLLEAADRELDELGPAGQP